MKALFALALLISLRSGAAAAAEDCLASDPTRVKADVAAAMNSSLREKDSRGLSLPEITNAHVQCANAVNFNPFGKSKISCHAGRSGRSGATRFEISCTATIFGCGVPSASCSLSLHQ